MPRATRHRRERLDRFKKPVRSAGPEPRRGEPFDLSWTSDPRQRADRLPTFGQRLGGYVIDVALSAVLLGMEFLAAGGGHRVGGRISPVGALILLYFFVGTAVWGRTLGKVAVGTRVVRVADGGVPG